MEEKGFNLYDLFQHRVLWMERGGEGVRLCFPFRSWTLLSHMPVAWVSERELLFPVRRLLIMASCLRAGAINLCALITKLFLGNYIKKNPTNTHSLNFAGPGLIIRQNYLFCRRLRLVTL